MSVWTTPKLQWVEILSEFALLFLCTWVVYIQTKLTIICFIFISQILKPSPHVLIFSITYARSQTSEFYWGMLETSLLKWVSNICNAQCKSSVNQNLWHKLNTRLCYVKLIEKDSYSRKYFITLWASQRLN